MDYNSDDIFKIHQQAWTLNYLYPERFGGAKIPDLYPVPSNTQTITTHRIIKPYSGSALVFFSPIIETTAPYFNNYDINTGLPIGNLSQYIVYADSNGQPLPLDENNVLLSLNNWGYSQSPTTRQLSAYKRLRVVGACIKCKVVDKVDAFSGIIEACMGVEVIGNGLKNDLVDLDRMSNHSNYRAFKADKEVIVKYRYNNEKYTHFGPYEPFSMVPFNIIRLSGLSNSASVSIETIIHIEGMLMPSLTHFATADLIPQLAKYEQQNTHQSLINDSDTITKEENDSSFYNNDYIPEAAKSYSKAKETVKNEIINDRDKPKKKKLYQKVVTEMLEKRDDIDEDFPRNVLPDATNKQFDGYVTNLMQDIHVPVNSIIEISKKYLPPILNQKTPATKFDTSMREGTNKVKKVQGNKLIKNDKNIPAIEQDPLTKTVTLEDENGKVVHKFTTQEEEQEKGFEAVVNNIAKELYDKVPNKYKVFSAFDKNGMPVVRLTSGLSDMLLNNLPQRA